VHGESAPCSIDHWKLAPTLGWFLGGDRAAAATTTAATTAAATGRLLLM